MAKRTKWQIFTASNEYGKLRSMLPKRLSDNGGLMHALPTVKAMELHFAQKSNSKMISLYEGWLQSPSTSQWNSYLGPLAVWSITDSGFKKAKEESERMLLQQQQEVAKRLQELQDLTHYPPESLLTGSYLTFPLSVIGITGYSKSNDFVPKTPKQVYAIYRIRSVYAQCKFEETDDPIEKLSWQEIIRRLEIAHGIYKNSIGSEKP